MNGERSSMKGTEPIPGARLTVLRVLFAVSILAWIGCGKPAGPDVDTAPFEAAVAKYLDEHNMALALKEVKAGPEIDGGKATMTASLTHAELGGASVTWDFEFEKSRDGTWKATGHQD